MTIYYNGKDISESVNITAAVARDTAGRCCDTIEIEFENASAWVRWQPETDDTIELTEGQYSTGEMYVNTVSPEEGKYRILATALPSQARTRRNTVYRNLTFGQIARSCASESGMGLKIYGIPESYRYECLVRDDESAAAFLERICLMEGAMLKCWNGKILIIGLETAQTIGAKQTVTVTTQTQGAMYRRREDLKLKTLTVITPYANATATDSAAGGKLSRMRCDLPATDGTQARRWAKSLLEMNNRNAEEMTVKSVFNAGWTAMARIGIDGGTDADGDWIIEEVTHDMMNLTSEAIMRRVIDTIE